MSWSKQHQKIQWKHFKGESLIQKIYIFRILYEIGRIFQKDSITSYFQACCWKTISGSSIYNERLFCCKRFELDSRSSCSREEKWKVNINIACILVKCQKYSNSNIITTLFLIGQLFMPSQSKECVTRELFLWL